MDKDVKNAHPVMMKETWVEPKVEWIKPQLVRLDDRDAKGKGVFANMEIWNGPYSTAYGPS